MSLYLWVLFDRTFCVPLCCRGGEREREKPVPGLQEALLIYSLRGIFTREEAVVLAHPWLLVWLVLSFVEVKRGLGLLMCPLDHLALAPEREMCGDQESR